MRAALRALWGFLRSVSGDAAYDRHAARALAAGAAPMSRRDFYLDTLRRRYSTINRCC